jgi:hypothetical protein
VASGCGPSGDAPRSAPPRVDRDTVVVALAGPPRPRVADLAVTGLQCAPASGVYLIDKSSAACGSGSETGWRPTRARATPLCRAGRDLARVTVPSLVLDADADPRVFPRDAWRIFSAIAAEEMQLVEVEGGPYRLSPGTTRRAVADRSVALARKPVV